jgi:hypothetical protein
MGDNFGGFLAEVGNLGGRTMTSLVQKKGEYTVGYGKPPVRTRFQKGMSGNPKGFPKGEQKLRFVLMRLLAMPVEELERFEPQTGTEMIAKQLMMTAIHGDARQSLRAAKFILDRVEGKVR